MKIAATLLCLWFAVGFTIEAAAWQRRHEAKTTKLLQQAEVEKQRAVERERAIAEKNLHQAEVFIRMCLDPVQRYAYLGAVVFECKAKLTKQRLY